MASIVRAPRSHGAASAILLRAESSGRQILAANQGDSGKNPPHATLAARCRSPNPADFLGKFRSSADRPWHAICDPRGRGRAMVARAGQEVANGGYFESAFGHEADSRNAHGTCHPGDGGGLDAVRVAWGR